MISSLLAALLLLLSLLSNCHFYECFFSLVTFKIFLFDSCYFALALLYSRFGLTFICSSWALFCLFNLT